jgi:hypothetical protein
LDLARRAAQELPLVREPPDLTVLIALYDGLPVRRGH